MLANPLVFIFLAVDCFHLLKSTTLDPYSVWKQRILSSQLELYNQVNLALIPYYFAISRSIGFRLTV